MDDSDTEPDLILRARPQNLPPPPAPRHPIPSMQEAFAESLIEATAGAASPKPKLRTGDAKARRDALLDQAKNDGPPIPEWRFRPGQTSHELRRLMAQISFGVYLLLNGMANSQISVVQILQGHIDEVDEFLETALEDIALATKDLKGRIEHLKLPMDNIDVFEKMLEDRNFRLQILDGNQKIEHILARTEVSIKQTMQDLEAGVISTREFNFYLAEQRDGQWRYERPDMIDIFDAMKRNTDGWFNALLDLQSKGSNLKTLIAKLSGMVSEIERRAGEVSRRTRFSIEPYSSPGHSPRPSNSSSVTTPPTTPGPRVANSPPRISLRLSPLKQSEPISFMDIRLYEESLFGSQDRPAPAHETRQAHEALVEATLTEVGDQGLIPRSPPVRNPRRLSERPTPSPVPPQEPIVEELENDGPLYILQPRTYTPQPPSPLPSPFVKNERPRSRAEPTHQGFHSPAPSADASGRQLLEPPTIIVEHAQLRSQPSKPKLVAIGARADPRLLHRIDTRPDSGLESQPETETETETEEGKHSRHRSSLRERISLKMTPPEAIQVPSHMLDVERPRYQSPRAYHSPDSAYVSDIERPPVNSMASIDRSLSDFSPPYIHPGLIPSPHSDKQYFRPINGNPHSPLQQRPHTAGSNRFPQPQRNIPSAMGMSMLSNVTTTTSKTDRTEGDRSLKKKRSAFGWLKKAFSLDDEERAAFEQKKKEESRNLYYDGKSPKFLDGRRIQPRPSPHPSPSFYRQG
ncbi:hypothetical protein B0T26DRAFT_631552 [Lasiosphaeria miniovina]|uniref:Uncharacterized protein n=1 Tax=Lasiosphaeria miniovina TaxID=1954250 RepID=A0AA40BFY6_9PEZI|nr:uncharacterized protein B0T26DRAFT_631552 [Lasiosphaeria miniovina]KAK0733532.1 hypothetical protein B0T26DRAFT_631552 [Lasiosphaeria miniovina]